MQPRVTAVLVARNGAQYLPKTLAALAEQTRRPDSLVFVASPSSDASAELLAKAGPTHLVASPDSRSFGSAVTHAMQVTPSASTDNEWLWLLGHDNAPAPRALSALLAAVEVAPSVAIAGPKLMRWDSPDVIASYGESLTRFGRSVALVTDELDQAQFDIQTDLLAVAASGMLVRRQVWTALGGFDPALPSVDAALDFCVRARLAGHRVVGVPAARVASAGPAELFGRRSLSAGGQNRIRRSAQLHRRFVYSPAFAVPLHWLTVLPLALLRALGHLLAKRPGLVGGELAAGIAAAGDGRVPSARRNLRRTRRLGWPAVGALRLTWADLRERRAHDRGVEGPAARERIHPGFFSGGGAWIVLASAIASIIAFGRGADAVALTGGGLAPLSGSVADLWQHVGYGWRDIGAGFVGAADPFSSVLAVLGSITFWSPSLSIIAVYLLAMPLSALGAWWCAARFAERGWAPAVAAVAWAAAPSLLASLTGGHLGAVLAHILLPPLVLAVVGAARSWSHAAVAGLLFAVVAASAPILVPALLVVWLAWMIARPKSIHRLVGIPVVAGALFAPLIWQQFTRGNGIGLLADPGVPTVNPSVEGWQLALASTDSGLSGWEGFLSSLGLNPVFAPSAAVILLAPLVTLAVLSLFLPGSRRAVPSAAIAFLGFATAVAASHLAITSVGASPTTVWAGSALSLYWLGLVGTAGVGLEALQRRAGFAALFAGGSIAVLAVPLFVAAATGSGAVTESNGRLLPAFVSAEASTRPSLGTLELAAQPDGAIAATVHRGQGTTLDEQSTLDSTDTGTSDADARLATLAGNISSRSGFDIAGELDSLQIAFVLVPYSSDDSLAARERVTEALDGNRLLTPVGDTATGYLWHYAGIADGPAPSGPGPTGTTLGLGILIGQAAVVGLTVLLAVPTTRRRRVRSVGAVPERTVVQP